MYLNHTIENPFQPTSDTNSIKLESFHQAVSSKLRHCVATSSDM